MGIALFSADCRCTNRVYSDIILKVFLYPLVQMAGRGIGLLQSESAVILIPKDPARTGHSRPMLLQRVMGAPLLTWLTHGLRQRGIRRFFLVCQDRFLNEARLCFPGDCVLSACADREAADPLHVFLSSVEGRDARVLVITGACVCLPPEAAFPEEPKPACACHVSHSELMLALDGKEFSFCNFLRSRGSVCTDREGFYTIATPAQLPDWAQRIRRAHLQALSCQGVEIWDYDQCYVDPGVQIGTGTVLLPGTILRGRTVVGSDCVLGPNALVEGARIGNGCRINASQVYESTLGNDCTVGPFACIRPGSSLGSRVRVGTAAELNRVRLGEGTHAGALCSLREFDSGRDCAIGTGCVSTAGQVVLEDQAVIGGGVTFAAPLAVGRSAKVGPGSALRDAVPAPRKDRFLQRH